MEREFKIQVTEQVRGTKTTYYTVRAESFDEATEKYHDGYADWYDDDGFEEDDVYDSDVEEVECMECYNSESYCECTDEDDEDDDDEDRRHNPNPGSDITVEDIKVGDIIEPADDYTRGHFLTMGGVVVTKINSRDRDGERRIDFVNLDGVSDYWYANDASRFIILDADEAQERQAAVAAEKEAKQREWATQDAINDLLSPSW